ncbi:hypothetical protein P8C59_005060 [Phyllachora maydis]|uniref:Exonuclease domain-containing protein n=1 Tax=Phyllachora maydis TaxID=1825666 RepID=A0AAD9MD49_9PEZI|nr:hypothetical protein P8C59_005060 [Phyllachora maydis]
MAPELSSNWKRLQAKIKAESTTHAGGVKRKARADDASESPDSESKTKRPDKAAKRSQPGMGVAQSSRIDAVPATGVSPSLALWAEDNDISPEDIAEAYGLGIKSPALLMTAEPARPNEGRAPGVDVGRYVAVDCEMVGVGDDGRDHALARVSVVDFHGRQVYDSFVRPRQRVKDWRTSVSGVGPKHMATAREFGEVQTEIQNLLKGRTLVGHDVRHDLAVLELHHPTKAIRDTAKFHGFKKRASTRASTTPV